MAPSNAAPLSNEAILYMVLLAFQFGLQPIVTRKFTPPTVCRSTVILCQEGLKFGLALFMLNLSGKRKDALRGWSIKTWISVAGIPAALYAVQNLAALMAYQNLDALTFNVLNQTKTLSAALCCYLVMGRKQSPPQIFALLLLLLSAIIMEGIISLDSLLGRQAVVSMELLDAHHFTNGVLPILVASFISGLAGALCQTNLQSAGGGRNPYLFSMELCAASSIFLTVSLWQSPDGKMIAANGFWDGWTTTTWIPILTNSIGGIIVGLVTKYAGSVRKGFALIFGIFISGLIQAPDTGVSREQIIGGALAAVSLWMHATNPYKAAIVDSAKRKEE